MLARTNREARFERGVVSDTTPRYSQSNVSVPMVKVSEIEKNTVLHMLKKSEYSTTTSQINR